jgi:hypothetical protein
VKQNNEILMRNHQSRLTGYSPFYEVNATLFPEVNATSFKGGHGRGPISGRECGRNNVWRRDVDQNAKSNDNNVGRYEK